MTKIVSPDMFKTGVIFNGRYDHYQNLILTDDEFFEIEEWESSSEILSTVITRRIRVEKMYESKTKIVLKQYSKFFELCKRTHSPTLNYFTITNVVIGLFDGISSDFLYPAFNKKLNIESMFNARLVCNQLDPDLSKFELKTGEVVVYSFPSIQTKREPSLRSFSAISRDKL